MLRGLFVACGTIATALTLSCSPSPALQEARQADFDALARELRSAPPKSPGAVVKLAQATLAAEIVRADSMLDRQFVRSLRACGGSLKNALHRRAKKRDALGAEAALLLYDLNDWLRPNPRRFRDSEDDAWRALAARATADHPELRHAYFTDADERVRQAATIAATDALDKRDVSALLEVARLDPSPLIRSKAVDALGAIGGESALRGLRSRYRDADESVRLAIVDAFARPKLATIGGWRQLERIVDRYSGFEALHAAYLLGQHPSDEGLTSKGRSRLRNFAENGTTEERRLAIRWIPTGAEGQTLLAKLTDDDDPAIVVAAWARLLGQQEQRAAAEEALLEIARSDTAEAYEARSALAAFGSHKVEALFIDQLDSENSDIRRTAGYGLLRLGAYEALAPLLADEIPGVRRSMACRILASKR